MPMARQKSRTMIKRFIAFFSFPFPVLIPGSSG
jgi:hypothetical protein